MRAKFITYTAVAGAIALISATATIANNPYAGLEQRTIKALSADAVDGHLKGYGLGYAKAAELNHYPGPAHLRELTEELGLSEDLLQKIIAIEEDMRAKAVKLGHKIVDLERQLDMMFAHAQAAPDLVTELSKKIGLLQGELRAVHLNAHLAVRPLLSDELVKRYDELRGYTGEETEDTKVMSSDHTHHHEH